MQLRVVGVHGRVRLGMHKGTSVQVVDTAVAAHGVAGDKSEHIEVTGSHVNGKAHSDTQQPEQSNGVGVVLVEPVVVEPVVVEPVVVEPVVVTVVVSKDAGSVAEGTTKPGSGIQKPSFLAFDDGEFS
jgi:hypothetical protein